MTLDCGHKNTPGNLNDAGNCLTCIAAAEWQELADKTSNQDLKPLMATIAGMFRSGCVEIDTINGSLLADLKYEKDKQDQARKTGK